VESGALLVIVLLVKKTIIHQISYSSFRTILQCCFFIQVVVIQFYPKSCNFIGVMSIFSEKSCKSAKQDTMRKIDDMKIEDQWFLEGLGRQYKVKKIHFNFQGIARWKNARKRTKTAKLHMSCCPMHICAHTMHPCTPLHVPCACFAGRLIACFSSCFSGKPLVFFS